MWVAGVGWWEAGLGGVGAVSGVVGNGEHGGGAEGGGRGGSRRGKRGEEEERGR